MARVANTYHLGVPDIDKTGASLLAVLVDNDDGGKEHAYSVYIGLVKFKNTPQLHGYEAERYAKAAIVAAHGTKLSHRAALGYFPVLKAEEYR